MFGAEIDTSIAISYLISIFDDKIEQVLILLHFWKPVHINSKESFYAQILNISLAMDEIRTLSRCILVLLT